MNSQANDSLVWDLPTRLFHGLLVVLIALQFATGEFGWLDMQWHFWFGYATLALIVFRILWGFFGSQTSRFSEFVKGPAAVIRYLRASFSTNPQSSIGHNPLGGWSVVVLLLSVTVQSISGLFASDDVDTDGPLADKVTHATVKWFSRVHGWNETVLLILIALHIVAVLLYLLLRHENLITPMIGGRKALSAQLRFASSVRAFVLLVISIAAVAAAIYFASR